MTPKLSIYVFSFNRGVFLNNVLRSVRACANDWPVTVIDDNSSDPTTIRILQNWRDDIKLIVTENEFEDRHRLGGLYNNMRYAFHDARSHDADFVLFIQDDMQLIRPLTNLDLTNATMFLSANERSAQLQPCFLKKYLSNLDSTHMAVDSSRMAYLRPSDFPGYSGFSAVGLFHLDRFSELFGELRNSEYENNQYAQECGIQMGYYVYPFMMYLPFSFTYRERRRRYSLRVVEWLGRSGFFPYETMSSDDSDRLFSRDVSEKAYAEDWLQCRGIENLPHWSYAGGLARLEECGGWRRVLGRFLSRMRKFAR